MGFIQKIQNKPQAEKIRLMWTVSIIIVILLLVIWIVTAKYQKNIAKDTTLFQSLNQSIHDVKNNFHK